MSSINQKLDYLLATKYKIKDAIEQKDTAVDLDGVPFRDYPNYIRGLALRTGELFAFELSDDGNLICYSNFETIGTVPYSLDDDGNLLFNKNDEDTGVYQINNEMLEVTF